MLGDSVRAWTGATQQRPLSGRDTLVVPLDAGQVDAQIAGSAVAIWPTGSPAGTCARAGWSASGSGTETARPHCAGLKKRQTAAASPGGASGCAMSWPPG